jgi:hypothetical protein
MDEKRVAMHKIVAAIHQAGLQDVVSADFEPWKSRVKIYLWCTLPVLPTFSAIQRATPPAPPPTSRHFQPGAIPSHAMRASVVGCM